MAKKIIVFIFSTETNLSQKIKGEEFFNLLSSVEESSTVMRRVNNLDLLFSVGTAELKTYIRLNEPPTGIVQERDLYTNINGGIGLFSARYNKYQKNTSFSESSTSIHKTYSSSSSYK